MTTVNVVVVVTMDFTGDGVMIILRVGRIFLKAVKRMSLVTVDEGKFRTEDGPSRVVHSSSV